MLGSKLRRLPKAWKDTLNLPKSTFPPRPPPAADRLPLLQKCTDDLYAWQRANRKGDVFTLHDGPPYANGDLHIGHALNKILKDITCRFQLSQGKRVEYVPGWDCHGLPIELKALEKYRLQREQHRKTDLDLVANPQKDALSVRKLARELAAEAVETQKSQFQEWGIMADWENAWKTMDTGFEVKQMKVFKSMVAQGLIYQRFKPVHWSPSTRTALAEAELEHRKDHVSTAVYVSYPLHQISKRLAKVFEGHSKRIGCVIWTTTPWTLPANQAIGFHLEMEYALVESIHFGLLLVAKSRLDTVQKECNESFLKLAVFKGSELAGALYRDPFWDSKMPSRPFLHADFVKKDSGSGFVHIAPGHGPEDYKLCLKYGILPFAPVNDNGEFDSRASPAKPSLLKGKNVLLEGNQEVIFRVDEHQRLLAQYDYVHSYPYDWRSKQPIILRATEQWFANVGNIQGLALSALDFVRFVPETSKTRLQSFVRTRSEWCISRQRAWGVPIPALYHKDTKEVLMTEESVSHISSVLEERGIEAWWSDAESDPAWTPVSARNKNGRSPYRRGKDTMDVWFDSGTSWTQTQRNEPVARDGVADVYLEGTDQHRGWFQSSLLTYIAYQGATNDALPKAPFRKLVTHGFTLDRNGLKMSKSEGNVVFPAEIMDGSLLPPLKKKFKGKMTEFRDAMGPDSLRLWVASCDYTKDVVVSPEGLKNINNALTKYRTTFKQLLGMLEGFYPASADILKNYDTSHKIAVFQLEQMETTVRTCYQNMEYHKAITEINRYVTADLSAIYLEAVKDLVYCGTNEEQLAAQATLYTIFQCLQRLLAPVTPLLVQEVWEHTPQHLRGLKGGSPFEQIWSDTRTQATEDDDTAYNGLILANTERAQLETDVPLLLKTLTVVQSVQEVARTDKRMGSSLQSFVMLCIGGQASADTKPVADLLSRYLKDLSSIFVVSRVEYCLEDRSFLSAEWSYQQEFELLGTKVVAHVYAPKDEKCVRCWRYLAPVDVKKEEAICERCEVVLEDLSLKKPELFVENHSSSLQ